MVYKRKLAFLLLLTLSYWRGNEAKASSLSLNTQNLGRFGWH